jgi:hypothetical protein
LARIPPQPVTEIQKTVYLGDRVPPLATVSTLGANAVKQTRLRPFPPLLENRSSQPGG